MWIKYLPVGKRGSSIYIVGRDASGRIECSTGSKTRAGAEAFAERYLAERARRRVPGRGETVGYARASEAYKAAKPHLSKVDIRCIDALAAHLGDDDCRTINHARLVAAADALKPGCSDATKNRKVIVFGAAVLHNAAANEWCDYKRVPKFWESRKSDREPARDNDLALLVANVEALPRGHKKGRLADRNVAFKKVLLMMLYELGLRLSHLLAVQVPHFDLQAGKLKVRIPKSDEWATLDLSPALVAAISNCLQEVATTPRKAMGKYVPRAGRFFPWTTNRGVYAWLVPLRERLGITYTPHMSRHALATAADAAQIPDKRAAQLGVWKDARSLHRYQHVRPDAIPDRDAGNLLVGIRREGKAK